MVAMVTAAILDFNNGIFVHPFLRRYLNIFFTKQIVNGS